MPKIWKVKYTVIFRSSSGMTPYEKRRNAESYVVAGDSLASVEQTLSRFLTNQETLVPITSGECLGNVITP